MKLETSLLILLSFSFLLSAKCKKDNVMPPAVLPPITQTGANTFGCKINGEVWVPYYKICERFVKPPCGVNIVSVYQETFLNRLPVNIDITFTKKDKNDIRSSFYIRTNLGMSVYTAGIKTDSINLEYYNQNSLIPYFSNTGISSRNKIEITKLDTTNKILSGLFEGVLYKSLTDSIVVTEGRFDLKFFW